MRIRHCDIVVRTDVPETWRALARQRRLWWAGTFRHWVVNVDRNLVQLPVFTLYAIAIIWSSIYFRWWNMIDVHSIPSTLPLLFAVYVCITVLTNLQVLSPWMLVFPLYAFVQTLVFPLVGAGYYVVLARRRGRLGRYRFSFGRREWNARDGAVVPRLLSPVTTHLARATCLLVGFSAGAIGGLPTPVLASLLAAAVPLCCASAIARRSSLLKTSEAVGSITYDAALPLLLLGALVLLLLSTSLSLVT
jgi:hypothetical protein